MQCELRWVTSVSASALHAAAAVDLGHSLARSDLAAALAAPVASLRRTIRVHDLPCEQFWRHVVPLSAGIDSNRQLADVTLRKIMGTGGRATSAIEALAACIGDIERAVSRLLPNLADKLPTRARPLREQWEAHGPGLLTLIARATDKLLIVPAADVVPVFPARGGDGRAHLSYNSVRIEAVLANPHANLPEVVRLGWMLAQLNNDLPGTCELFHRERLPLISGLAVLPPVLSAAAELNLCRCDLDTIRLALDAWHFPGPKNVDLAETANQWWDTYRASRPPWNVAMTALARMVVTPN